MAIEQYYNNPNYLAAIDDAGLEEDSYENFAQIANPGFNLPYAAQIGSGLVSIFNKNPMVNLFAKGIGYLADRTRLPGVVGGADLRGDTGLDTFRRSTSFADFFQRRRDQKAREDAAARGLAKQQNQALQAMRGPIGRDNGGNAGGGFADNSNASAPGGSDAMGSFAYGGLARLL